MSMKFILLIYVNCQQMFALYNIYQRDKYNTLLLKSWENLNNPAFKFLISVEISCSFELSLKKFITLGPGLTYQCNQCILEGLGDLYYTQ